MPVVPRDDIPTGWTPTSCGCTQLWEFPVKPVVAEWGGVDVMGPWLRVRDTDRLLLCERTVHWSAACPFLQRGAFSLTPCYCVDKLHKCFHYDVDDNFCLHVNSRCSENVDIAAGWIWPVVVMCRWCCPFPEGTL